MCLLTNCFIIKNFRVGSVWILSANLPSHEKWIPINIIKNKIQVKVFVNFSPQKGRLSYFNFLPVCFKLFLSCFCYWNEWFIFKTIKVFWSKRSIFLVNIFFIFCRVIFVHQAVYYYDSSWCISNVNSTIIFIMRLDFNCSVHFTCRGSSYQQRNVDSGLLKFLCIKYHLIERRGN